MKKLFSISTALLMMCGIGSAEAGDMELGWTGVGPNASSPARPNYQRGTKYWQYQAGTLTKVCAYLDGNGASQAASQPVRYVVYRDANDVPGERVVESPEFTIAAGTPGGWKCQEIGWTPVQQGWYWLMIHTGGTTAGPVRFRTIESNSFAASPDVFDDGPDAQMGPVSTSKSDVSIYAETIFTKNIRNVGRLSVGSTPSGVLRVNYKRGSSLSFPSAGVVSSFSAFLDQPSSAGASQSFRFALYEDVNGAPGPLVVQSYPADLISIARGAWVTLRAPEATVHAGKYWLMIHTGGSTPYMRYFYSGVGDWFGNADTFSDGSSNPFGTTAAGDGTVSAFVSYQPGTTPGILGRQTIGPDTLIEYNSGMIASRYYLTARNATLTSLYAYVDGFGGASGSQQVRMVIYGDESGIGYGTKAQSVDVTIPAGQAAGWLKFTIPPTTLPSGHYWIGFQSGPTSQVVRLYRSPNNVPELTCQKVDTFEDGPDGGILNSDFEMNCNSSPPSMYATYTAN